jgi:hypothetical protein
MSQPSVGREREREREAQRYPEAPFAHEGKKPCSCFCCCRQQLAQLVVVGNGEKQKGVKMCSFKAEENENGAVSVCLLSPKVFLSIFCSLQFRKSTPQLDINAMPFLLDMFFLFIY